MVVTQIRSWKNPIPMSPDEPAAAVAAAPAAPVVAPVVEAAPVVAEAAPATPNDPAAVPDPLAAPSLLADAGKPAEATPEAKAGNEAANPEGDTPPVLAAGAPEAYALTLPEGLVLDDRAWKVAEPILRDANVGPEQANALAARWPEILAVADQAATDRQQEAIVTIRKEWADQSRADPELSNPENLAIIAKSRDTLFGKGLLELVEATGLGNHPEFLRHALVLGRQLQEGSIHIADTPVVPAKPEKSDAGSLFYGDAYKGPQKGGT